MTYQRPTKEERNQEFLKSYRPDLLQPYQEDTIKQKKTFLIICEGKNTEPCYFEGFPVPSKDVIILGGHGSKTRLVDFAIRQKTNPAYEGREIWCVYDYDVKPDEGDTQPADFNGSILKAAQNDIMVAWSNDAFELWFLLHYQELEAALSRNEIYPLLKKYWKLESFSKEAKVKAFCDGHYERHLDSENSVSQEQAIRRARKLHEAYKVDQNYAKQCPCTTVYLLVEELNDNLK
jgi:hypothetical protein